MSTYRELINQVLIRLREDTIPTNWSGAINDSSTITDYQKVIGALVKTKVHTLIKLARNT